MAGAELRRLRSDVSIVTAGTLVIDGLPLSVRTRAALEAVQLDCPQHRSRQATTADLDEARVIVAMAPEHVFWVRRTDAAAAPRTTTLVHLVRELERHDATLDRWLETAQLSRHVPAADEEIVDPGGGEVDGYISAAQQIVDLIGRVANRF